MIVEFYGLPGTGKSTVARALAQETRLPIVAITNKKELIWLNIVFCLKHPLFALYSLAVIVQNSTTWNSFHFKFMNFFLHRNACYEKAKRTRDTLIVEGYFQNAISVFNKHKTEQGMLAYLQRFPKSDLLVIFHTPSQERLQRIHKRDDENRVRHTDPNMNAIMEGNDELVRKVVVECGVSFLVVDGTKPLKENMAAISQAAGFAV